MTVINHVNGRRIVRLVAGVSFCSAVISGCAQFSKEECATGNWRSRGHDVGAKGAIKQATFNNYAKECQKDHGIVLSNADYFAGYDDGLKLFCTESKGHSLGASGAKYFGVCTPELEPSFLVGYDNGLAGFCTIDSGSRMASKSKRYHGVCPAPLRPDFLSGYVPGLETKLPQVEVDLQDLRDDLAAMQAELFDSTTERSRLRQQLNIWKPLSLR